MKKSIVNSLNKDDAKEMEVAFGSSSRIRKRLAELLEKEKQGRINQNLGDSAYDCPNWSYKQAHNQGYAEGLRYAISLLE